MDDVDAPPSRSPHDAEPAASLDISLRVVVAAFAGGALGLLAMSPVLVGLPLFLGLFEAEPLVDVAALGRVLGLEPSFVLGLLLFAVGGTVALPLLFVVAAGFLPPRGRRAVRGVVFATIMWTGFVIAFWPGWRGGVVFLALSLVAHWIYGYALGGTMERVAHVPEHTV